MIDLPSLVTIVVAVTLLGIAKGGFGGAGTPVALPVMALGLPADLALGVMLPLLMVMDVVSLRSHWANIDKATVLYALPSAALGVLLGSALISVVPSATIGGVIGVLAIAFALLALRGQTLRLDHWPKWTSGIFGGASGLTSTLAHAGGPPIQMFLLSKGYAPAVFVATSSGFMAGVNLLKVGPYLYVGALDGQAALWALALAPLAAAAAYLGVWVSRVLSKRVFALSINTLLILVGIKLIWDALV